LATIGNLAIKLSAHGAGLSSGLEKAQKQLKGFASGALSTFGGLALFDLFKKGAGALKNFTTEGFGAIDNLNDLSQRLGVSTEFLTGLEHAANLSGSSLEEMEIGITKLSRALGNTNSKEVIADFARIGLNAKELADMGLEKAFDVIADRIASFGSKQEQAAAAFDVFGKASAKMLQILQEGSGGLQAFRDDAVKLGLSFDALGAGKVAKANDAIDRLKGLLTGIGRQLAIELSPFIEEAADKLTELGAGGTSFGKLMVNAMEQVALAAMKVADAFGGIEGAMLRLEVAKVSIEQGITLGTLGLVGSTDKNQEQFSALMGRIRVLEDTGARTKQLQDFFAKLRSGLGGAGGGPKLGMSKLDREKIEERRAAAEKIKEEFATPAEKLAKEMSKLEDLVSHRAISPELFGQAAAKLEADILGAKAAAEVKGPEALTSGSREALSTIARFERQGQGGDGVQQRMAAHLQRGVDLHRTGVGLLMDIAALMRRAQPIVVASF